MKHRTPPINENSNLHCMQTNENKEEKKITIASKGMYGEN